MKINIARAYQLHPVLSTFGFAAISLIVFFILFDWNWLRPSLERYVSKKTQRTFTVSDLDVKLGWTPIIRMRDLHFGNASWSKEPAMANAEMVEFSLSLRDLPDKILIPRVALTKPDLVFEKLKDERKNWVLSPPSESTTPSKLLISTLSVDQGKI
ncbi:MAG: AsmA family protein, partial [Pseudomonas sp.]